MWRSFITILVTKTCATGGAGLEQAWDWDCPQTANPGNLILRLARVKTTFSFLSACMLQQTTSNSPTSPTSKDRQSSSLWPNYKFKRRICSVGFWNSFSCKKMHSQHLSPTLITLLTLQDLYSPCSPQIKLSCLTETVLGSHSVILAAAQSLSPQTSAPLTPVGWWPITSKEGDTQNHP